jgi:hypothetical protein
MTWQPVQPPREEEYLGEISLGLHTIESFDSDAPKPYEAKVQDFQEMSFDRLDVESSVPPAAEPAGDASLSPEVPAASSAAPMPASPDPGMFHWTQLPKSPLPAPEPAGPPKHQQNKSSFETWLNRLKGRS